MSRQPTADGPNPPEPRTEAPPPEPPPARRAALAVVAAALAFQVVLAVAALTQPRPAHYGWQMYSSTQYVPDAWSVTGGRAAPLDAPDLLVHDRAEIDLVKVLRSMGCEQIVADTLRYALPDGTFQEVPCR